MDYISIEKRFTEYIIGLLGPNEELDKQREEKFKFIRQLITTAFEQENPEIKPHVFCFGSFPLKTYLQESDLDITVIFEDKSKNGYLLNSSFDFSNKMLLLIQTSFENHNSEMKETIFSDINLIFADIKLIKCKYENLSIDISINNFAGLSKLVFMDFIEQKMCPKFNSNHTYMFKRTLILIKAWAYFEGGILGSNISLMANYALEVLVIYVFNNYHHLFTSELEALFLFFKILKEIDWDNEIIHLFGSINTDSYMNRCSEDSDLLWYVDEEDNNSDKFIINPQELFKFAQDYETFKDMDKLQYFNTNKKSIPIKNINIIDPMFNNNNLGKSINFHNFSKIKKVIEFVNNDIENIIMSRSNIKCNPFKYLNSLLKLFSKSLTSQFSELLFFTLPQPKIVINPWINEDESLHKNVSNKSNFFNIENNYGDNFNDSFSSLNDNLINGFNKAFTKECNNLCKSAEETKNNGVVSMHLNSVLHLNCSTNNLLVTKEILDYIMKKIDDDNNENKTVNNNDNEKKYIYPSFYNNGVIEEFLKKLK